MHICTSLQRSPRGFLQQGITAARNVMVQCRLSTSAFSDSESDESQQYSPKRKLMLTFAKRTTGSLRAPPTNFSTTPLDPLTNPLLVLRVRINMTCAPSFNSTVPRAYTHNTMSASHAASHEASTCVLITACTQNTTSASPEASHEASHVA